MFILFLAGGGFNISPMKLRNGKPRTQVQHLIQIDLKGWGMGYISSFQQHCLLQMLNSVAGEFLLRPAQFVVNKTTDCSILLLLGSGSFILCHASWRAQVCF